MSFYPRLESRDYSCRDPSRWPRGTIYPQKLALSLPTSGGCSVGLVRSRTQAMEFSLFMSTQRYKNNKGHITQTESSNSPWSSGNSKFSGSAS
jgi:hypothetical protein